MRTRHRWVRIAMAIGLLAAGTALAMDDNGSDFQLDVSKTAQTTHTRTWHWEIEKSVTPTDWQLFTGDSGISQYTVTARKSGYTDWNFAVSGTIKIENNTPFDTTITDVSDVISPSFVLRVSCESFDFPGVLAAGQSLLCAYATPLPDGADRTNTATVTTEGIVAGNTGSAVVTFGAPTSVVNDSIAVDDSNGGSWGFSESGSVMYDRTFTCDGDAGTHSNTATIRETGESANATVSVACYGLTVTKSADTDFKRTWGWAIEKSADPSELTLSPGQTFTVGYRVDVGATPTDSDFAVSGDIEIATSSPSLGAFLTRVSDTVDGVAATVDCPEPDRLGFLRVHPGGSLRCTYSADLPDGIDRTNTATATLQNFSTDAASSTVIFSGTTDFDGTYPVVFGSTPGEEVDECIDLDDSLFGFLDEVCVTGVQQTFGYEYRLDVGPFMAPDDCGENQVVNTASFTGKDSGTTDEKSWTITVTVPCDTGCTLTPGYWKTHSELGPAPYDDTWAQLPNGAGTVFFGSGQSWHEVLWTASRGNAYYILARAYVATSLNVWNGVTLPPEVFDAWKQATVLFETFTPDEIGAVRGNRAPRPQFLQLAGLLDMYNNGLLGPGHCSEDSSSE